MSDPFRTLEETVMNTTQALGEDFTYTPSGSDPVTIKGFFDNQFVEVEQAILLKPTVRINLADLDSSPGKGDAVTIRSTVYQVMESRTDGFGGSLLILMR